MQDLYYSIHGLIDVIVDTRVKDSIIDNLDFQIGFFKTDGKRLASSHQITIKTYKDFIPDPSRSFETFHLVRGVTGRYYDDPIARVAFEKTDGGYTIYADAPNFLINLFVQLILIEYGITLVHAAAVVDKSGRVILLPGPGGVGKTAILGHMVKEKGYCVLGDDIVGLSDKGECLAFPRSFVLKEYHRDVYPELLEGLSEEEPKVSFSNKLKRVIHENAPFVGIARGALRQIGMFEEVAQRLLPHPTHKPPFLAAVPVEDIFGKDSVAERGMVDHIIFMQRYDESEFRIESISEQALCRRMFAIIQHEWVGSMRQFFSMGALGMVDLEAYFNTVSVIMHRGVAGRRCRLLSIPDNASPDELADYFASHF